MASLVLSGCATTARPQASIGNPLDAHASIAEKGNSIDHDGYLAVHDMPPPRPLPLMESGERERIKAALIAARDRQAPNKPLRAQQEKNAPRH